MKRLALALAFALSTSSLPAAAASAPEELGLELVPYAKKIGERRYRVIRIERFTLIGGGAMEPPRSTDTDPCGPTLLRDHPIEPLAPAGHWETQLRLNLVGQIVITGAFAAGLMFGAGEWLVFCLPVLFQIAVVFGNMAFWSLAGRMFNVQQGKRLFGIVGTGEWLAMVLMGFLTPVVAPLVGLPNRLHGNREERRGLFCDEDVAALRPHRR